MPAQARRPPQQNVSLLGAQHQCRALHRSELLRVQHLLQTCLAVKVHRLQANSERDITEICSMLSHICTNQPLQNVVIRRACQRRLVHCSAARVGKFPLTRSTVIVLVPLL